ncbi:MAG: ribonuclease H-like domain-containing protein [Novipirellula sp. JB048]
MSAIVFDIETGPLPLEEIQQTLPPFDRESVKHPGEFDPSSVKIGNLGEAKAAEKIEKARESHEAECVKHAENLDKAESKHWFDILDKAALSAVTGQVVAVGYQGKQRTLHLAIDGISERSLLAQFWRTYKSARAARRSLVGFNIKPFDVPFLAQRSWILGVEVPPTILTATGYLDNVFIDLMDRWKCGVRGWGQNGHGTLDAVCRSCGLTAKPSDCSGADFAGMLWSDSPEEVAKAKAYLENDLEMTAQLAERLGVN